MERQSGWRWLLYYPLALPLQGWQSPEGEWSGDRMKAGAGEPLQGGSLVPGDDASGEVTVEAHSPSGEPRWSCALLEI